MTLTVGSLFSGIGGMGLGLQRAGMQIKWQVEIDPFCQRVLAKHWPDVPKHGDVRNVGKHNLESVDLIAGGFPCQDISRAGKRKGIEGERSGLWSEFYRIICEIRPQYALVENVSDLLIRGIRTILADLAEIGYDTEWGIISAAAIGSPQLRERAFILAYPNGKHGKERVVFHEKHTTQILEEGNKNRIRLWAEAPAYPMGMADGIPDRVDRLRALGNAVVPQVAEWIGKRVMEIHNRRSDDA